MLINTLVWNARSLATNFQSSKIPELSRLIFKVNAKIILISETWLKESSILNIPHFTCHRTDRERGGVCVLIHNSIPHKFFKQTVEEHAEAISVKILDNNREITITSLYCSPSNDRSHALAFFSKVLETAGPSVIAGDFNAKHHAWNNKTETRIGQDLFKLCNTFHYNIHSPDGPTLIPTRGEPSVVDFVISKNIIGVSSPKVLNELSSDHFPLSFNIPLETALLNDFRIPNLKKANWKSFRSELDKSFTNISQSLSKETDFEPDEYVAQFESAIHEAARKAIPMKLPPKHRHPYDSELHYLTVERNFHRHKFISSGNRFHRSEKNHFNRLIKLKSIELHSAALEKRISSLSTHDHSIFQYAKALKQNNIPPPPLITPLGVIAYSNIDKAEALAAAFEEAHNLTVNTKSNKETAVNSTYESISRDPNNFPVHDRILIDEVVEIVKKLKTRKAPGPDNISNLLIKNLPNSGLEVLTKVLNHCCNSFKFPLSWKIGKIVAIPKSGKDCKIPSNHRPISLLSNLGKIFEKIILNRLVKFEKQNEIFVHTQFGFRTDHSTIQQVLRITEHAAIGFNNKKSTGVVSLDVQKAFDSIWHNGIIHKLNALKFPIHLIKIIGSYLGGRKAFVSLSDASSRPYEIKAGVPQGSLLAPFLFNIYINDIKKPKNCEIATYADDTLLFCQRQSKNANAIKTTLENGLRVVQKHFATWKIQINEEKTQFIVLSRSTKMPALLVANPPRVNGLPLKWCKSIKYLGVTLDSRLSYKAHIDSSISNAKTAISMLSCILKRNSPAKLGTKLMILKAYIRPILTYAGIIIHNAPKKHFGKLQILQNKYLRTALNAPFYTRNIDLHSKTKMPTIDEFVSMCEKTFYEKARSHENPLINSLGDYDCSLRYTHKMPRRN